MPREACREVQVLRLLAGWVPRRVRQRAVDRLCRKYASGRRSAYQVVLGLRALAAQNESDRLRELATGALVAVDPVPTVLWRWLCEHADELGVCTLRHMLRLAGQDARYDKHLLTHRHKLVATPDGLVALVHECDLVPWGPQLAHPAVASFLDRFTRGGTAAAAAVTSTTSCTSE